LEFARLSTTLTLSADKSRFLNNDSASFASLTAGSSRLVTRHAMSLCDSGASVN
jgi:hypothetical protein